MTGGSHRRQHRLLVATESHDLFLLIRDQIAVGGGDSLRPQHCQPDSVDATLRQHDFDAVVVTQPRFYDELPAVVRRWKEARPDLQVLLLFHHLPAPRALVELMRAGAFDVAGLDAQPLDEASTRDLLANLVQRLEEVRTGSFERQQARQSLANLGLLGTSVEMQNLFVQIQHAARLTCSVLISGEPGSGKRLVAHTIHALSPRRTRPLVTVDCASLSPTLLDTALFGASAAQRSQGAPPGRGALIYAAQKGTLLLNEVGETPYGVQLDLLRMLESSEPSGPAPLDVRILSTISRRIDELIELRVFRADLCYRLNVLPLDIPPLRRRIEDVPLLARYFLSRHERDNRTFQLSDEAVAALCRYPWPGNIRELRAAIEHAVARSVDDNIVEAHLPPSITGARPSMQFADGAVSGELNLAKLEEHAILRALQISGFDKAKTARLLGIGKTTMYRKLKLMSSRHRPA